MEGVDYIILLIIETFDINFHPNTHSKKLTKSLVSSPL